MIEKVLLSDNDGQHGDRETVAGRTLMLRNGSVRTIATTTAAATTVLVSCVLWNVCLMVLQW